MNHYAKILSFLEALPEDQRMLMSGVRRGLVKDTLQPCGCLFGSLVPPNVSGDDDDLKRTFFSTSGERSPMRHWWAEVVGEVPIFLRDAIYELEYESDRYMPNGNTASECRARYDHMRAYLRQRAEAVGHVE